MADEAVELYMKSYFLEVCMYVFIAMAAAASFVSLVLRNPTPHS